MWSSCGLPTALYMRRVRAVGTTNSIAVLCCFFIVWHYIWCVQLYFIMLPHIMLCWGSTGRTRRALTTHWEEKSIRNFLKYLVGSGCHFKCSETQRYRFTHIPTSLGINDMEVPTRRALILLLNLAHKHSWYVCCVLELHTSLLTFLPDFLFLNTQPSINISCSCLK